MKKLNYLTAFVLLIATIFAISCTKESALLVKVPTSGTYIEPPVSVIGGMIDLGLINSETRVMATNFTAKNIGLDGVDAMMDPSAQVTLIYYVDKDAQIPDGEYSFSNSDSKSPFTFDSAVFGGGVDSDGNLIASENIVDGSVVVSREGAEYTFLLQGHLQSGKILSLNANGPLSYNDNHIYNADMTNAGNTGGY